MQLQSFIPWQQWLWQGPSCEQKKKHRSLFSAGAGGMRGGTSSQGQPHWKATTATGTLGLTEWHWGKNKFILGIQSEWMGNRLSNAAEGYLSLQTFEVIGAGTLYGSQEKIVPYLSLLLGGGGGFGHVSRPVHFDDFSSGLRGNFSLATWKGSCELGAHFHTKSLHAETYAAIQDVGTTRYGFREKTNAIGLYSHKQTFSTMRTGVGGRISGSWITSTGHVIPAFSLFGYWQKQIGGSSTSLDFVQASCGNYRQTAYGLSPLGILLSGQFQWKNDKGLFFGGVLTSDISSRVVTYGGELESGFCF
ncbi:MAG: hypothetical protein FJZ58_06840 [Chlamydiae bacterium]|nr:hypothetical protein [Chlamydiota bacterium]